MEKDNKVLTICYSIFVAILSSNWLNIWFSNTINVNLIIFHNSTIYFVIFLIENQGFNNL